MPWVVRRIAKIFCQAAWMEGGGGGLRRDGVGAVERAAQHDSGRDSDRAQGGAGTRPFSPGRLRRATGPPPRAAVSRVSPLQRHGIGLADRAVSAGGIGRAGADASVSQGFGFRSSHCWDFRSATSATMLGFLQFPRQLADADASPQVYLLDPSFHLLVVTLPRIQRHGRSLVAHVGRFIDLDALGQRDAGLLIEHQSRLSVRRSPRAAVSAVSAPTSAADDPHRRVSARRTGADAHAAGHDLQLEGPAL